ncbi:MAG: NTP transferase domain-containing protein [Clostridia bacterium]|nr:NTP transferase domain-containing protein [Clostridia bacterium]
MRALIFNSGMGTRMGTADKPKCMAELGGCTIIKHQLHALAEAGITDIVITTGHLADVLRGHIKDYDVNFAHNPLYSATNYIYSMYLAKTCFEDNTQPVLVLHGDVVFEQSVINELTKTKDNAVTVDKDVPLPEKDFKALLIDNTIHKIGVDVFADGAVACQPMYRFTALAFDAFMAKVIEFCNSGNTGVYAENALNTLLPGLMLKPLYLSGRLCQEADTPQDLQEIRQRIVL